MVQYFPYDINFYERQNKVRIWKHGGKLYEKQHVYVDLQAILSYGYGGEALAFNQEMTDTLMAVIAIEGAIETIIAAGVSFLNVLLWLTLPVSFKLYS